MSCGLRFTQSPEERDRRYSRQLVHADRQFTFLALGHPIGETHAKHRFSLHTTKEYTFNCHHYNIVAFNCIAYYSDTEITFFRCFIAFCGGRAYVRAVERARRADAILLFAGIFRARAKSIRMLPEQQFCLFLVYFFTLGENACFRFPLFPLVLTCLRVLFE